MVKVKVIQTNMTSGVVDPLLEAREDSTFYYNALADGRNILIMPQGGARRRPGYQFIRPVMRKLQLVDLESATITAPNGGSVANIHDGNLETVLLTSVKILVANPYIVAKFVFTEPVSVDAVDVIDYRLTEGALDDEFFVQYGQDDLAWNNFAPAFNWDAALRSRRLRNGNTITAKYWRIVRIGATSTDAYASIADIQFLVQGNEQSKSVRLAPFAYSTDEAYMMACSDRHIDVLVGDNLAGSIAIPHTETQLPVMNWSQSLDTMILYHGRVPPQRIFRQRGDDEFDYRDCEFENIPEVDLGAGTGGLDEVQHLNVSGLASGNVFTLLLDGVRTEGITAGTDSVTAANIQTALRALSNTSGTGVTVTNSTIGGAGFFIITFAGEDGKRPWGEIKASVLSGNSVWDITRKVKGRYPGEPIMSEERGWPRCGTINQQRHIMGGFPSVPNAFMASFHSEFFNFDTEIDDPAKGLLFRPDTDQVGAVYQIVGGRHLSIFTNDGEFYIPNEPLSESAAAKLTTRSGIKEGLRVHESDGALLFVQGVKDDREDREIGTSIREFLFVDTEQSYMANPVSKLSSHLIKNPIDNAMRKAVNTDESDILLLVNEDGTGTAFTVLRNELVNAFVPVTLRDGDLMKAVGVDKKRRVYFINERQINGQPVQYIERWNDDLLLDCGDIITIPAETMIASEGQTVFSWTFASPDNVAEIGVRVGGARVDGFDVDLDAKTITMHQGAVGGERLRISRMMNTIPDIDHLEGETIQTYIDGSPGDEYVVSGGSVTLNVYADTEIQYGFGIDVYGKLMPFRIPGEQSLGGSRMRVLRAILSLYKTGDLEIRVNGGQWRNVPLVKMDHNILDRSMDEMLFTGEKDVRGLLGWSVGGILEFRQTPQRPAPLTIRAITREVSF